MMIELYTDDWSRLRKAEIIPTGEFVHMQGCVPEGINITTNTVWFKSLTTSCLHYSST